MTSIDETSQAMFGMGRLNPMSLLQIMREAKAILDAFNKNKNKAQASEATEYHFTGQHTDIAFVAENGTLNAAEIERLPDGQLKDNVILSFSDAVKDGYLEFDMESRDFSLTQKGTEHINSDSFKEQFEKDQLGQIAENKARIELRGKPSDINVFRFTNSIDLNHLAHGDPAMYKRVQDYFSECEKYGFVNISSEGIVTPTNKCQEYFAQTPLQDFNITKITRDNVKEVSEELKNTSEDKAKDAFGNVLDKAESGIAAAEKAASYVSGNSSGSDTAKEGAKIAARQAAKKAQEAAAKKAAEQTAKQAAAKTAAKSAASSTGYGAAVVAAVELTAKGADALTKMDTQTHKVTVHR